MKRIILLSIVAILIVAIGYPTIKYVQSQQECANVGKALRASNEDIIEEFQNIDVVRSQPGESGTVYVNNGCLTPKPYLQVQKSYGVSANGGVLVKELTEDLTRQGYKITEETYTQDDCGVTYSANISNGHRPSSLTLDERRAGTDDCVTYNPVTISKDVFDEKTITYVFLRLETIEGEKR